MYKGCGSINKSLIAYFIILILILDLIYRYMGAGVDDDFITLWAGKTLGSAPWFINYNGELQEISSSILGAICAKISFMISEKYYYIIYKSFGLISAIFTLIFIWKFRAAIFIKNYGFCSIISILLVGSSSIFGYNALNGLETGYYTLIIFCYYINLVLYLDSRKINNLIVILILTVLSILTRPEGFWLIGVSCLSLLILWKDKQKNTFIFLSIILPIAALLVLFLTRYHFVHALLPNPVYAKVSFGYFDNIINGSIYIMSYYKSSPLGILLGILLIIAMYRYISMLVSLVILKKHLNVNDLIQDGMLFVMIVAYEIFIILVSGDWMPNWRFLAPILPLHIILGVNILNKIIHKIFIPEIWQKVLVTIGAVIVVAYNLAYHSPQDNSIKFNLEEVFKSKNLNDYVIQLNMSHRRDNTAIVPFLENQLVGIVKKKQHIRWLSYQGGYVPFTIRGNFTANQVYFVDTTGLLNLNIAQIGVRKIPTGNSEFSNIAQILLGNSGELSTIVNSYRPNMIYVFGLNTTDKDILENLGFHNIWEKASAIVLEKL